MNHDGSYETIPTWCVLTMVCATTVVVYGGDIRFAAGLAVASAFGAAINRMADHTLNQEIVEVLASHYAVTSSVEESSKDEDASEFPG